MTKLQSSFYIFENTLPKTRKRGGNFVFQKKPKRELETFYSRVVKFLNLTK